jgi:hypothetical protein
VLGRAESPDHDSRQESVFRRIKHAARKVAIGEKLWHPTRGRRTHPWKGAEFLERHTVAPSQWWSGGTEEIQPGASDSLCFQFRVFGRLGEVGEAECISDRACRGPAGSRSVPSPRKGRELLRALQLSRRGQFRESKAAMQPAKRVRASDAQLTMAGALEE